MDNNALTQAECDCWSCVHYKYVNAELEVAAVAGRKPLPVGKPAP